MSAKTLTAEELAMIKRFYSWTPDQSYGHGFRCLVHPSRILMTEAQCMARATKPQTFEKSGSDLAGCSGKCPRWKYYRKLVKKNQEPLAYPPHRRVP